RSSLHRQCDARPQPSFPPRRSSDLEEAERAAAAELGVVLGDRARPGATYAAFLDLVRRQLGEQYDARDLEASGLKVYSTLDPIRSEEHTSELQSREKLVCRRLLEKK